MTYLRDPEGFAAGNTFPGERLGRTRKVHIRGLTGYVTINRHEDGAPREVFLHGFGGFGSTLQGYSDTFGIMLSIALQAGISLRTLAHKFARKRIEPYGETDDPEIPYCWSIPDYVITRLVLEYGDEELINEVQTERTRPNGS